jgi:hypothetical protein
VTPCSNCDQSTKRPHWGGYNTHCAHCCARLLASARPLKHAQEGLLFALALRPANAKRAAILLALKERDVRHANQCKN